MKVDINEEVRKKALRKEGNFYAQIPVRLLLDKRVRDGEVRQYGVYHSYCPEKNIASGKCKTFASQETIAKDLGCDTQTVKRRQKNLDKTGYISIARRKSRFGTNIITLNMKPVRGRR